MTSVLVTGGAGFVGSSLAIGIRAAHPDWRVMAVDNLRRRGSELNLPRLRSHGVEFRHVDIRQAADLEGIPAADVMIECSAEPSALAGYDDSPSYAVDTNLVGTFHCLEWARRHGAGVVFLSSSRVYPIAGLGALAYSEDTTRLELEAEQAQAGASGLGISEAFSLEGHRSLYGATKLCSELLLTEYRAMYGLRGIVNRCGLIAGPGQMGKIDQGVVVFWLASHVYGKPLRYIGYGGTGKQVRDVLHIDDLMTLVALQIEGMEQFDGETFNVGGGAENSASLLELTGICEEVTGKRLEIGSEAETRPGDVPIYVTDNGKVSAATGWAPTRGVDATCRDIHDWIRANEALLEPILAG